MNYTEEEIKHSIYNLGLQYKINYHDVIDILKELEVVSGDRRKESLRKEMSEMRNVK